jgi:hypothetical protein
MADETTKDLSGDDLLRVLYQRVDQMFVQQQRLYDQQQELYSQQQEMNARLIRVESWVGERLYDTRPKMDLLIKEVSDGRQEVAEMKQDVGEVKQDLRRTNNEMRLLREEVWGERKLRADLEYRIELLERKAA